MKYPFVRPSIPAPEAFADILRPAYEARYFTNFGPVEQAFSRQLQNRYGQEGHSVTLANNATCGLTAALVALGVRGRVAIPAFTFPATLHAVLAARCEAVLVDIDPNTCSMSADALERTLRRHDCHAVMPVRPYGFVQDLSGILSIAARRSLPVVIDAAASLGCTRVDLQPNVVEVFSLHATKAFGIGEGGAIFASAELGERVRSALNFGLRKDRTFGYGINGKMTELQAAVGQALLATIDSLIAGRQKMVRQYEEVFHRYQQLRFPGPPGPNPWSTFPVIFPHHVDCEGLQTRAHEMGLQIRRYYTPTLAQGFDEPLAGQDDIGVATEVSAYAVCFPVYDTITNAEFAEIGSMIAKLFTEFKIL
jgi:dTDP-4-amino-4,6-dideoxygalactose transaminase